MTRFTHSIHIMPFKLFPSGYLSGRHVWVVEGRREICINYRYMPGTGDLWYAASIFRKTDTNDGLGWNDIVKHEHTTDRRWELRPAHVYVQNYLTSHVAIIKEIRHAMCHGPGCKGPRPANNRVMPELDDHPDPSPDEEQASTWAYPQGSSVCRVQDCSSFGRWTNGIQAPEGIQVWPLHPPTRDWLLGRYHYRDDLVSSLRSWERFCNINKSIFDINNSIVNINVDGWACKCICKNSEFNLKEKIHHIHDISLKSNNYCTCNLNELRFNHYNVNNIQIDWMKGFFNKDIFEHGKDNTMKKFNYLLKKYNIPNHVYNKQYFDSIKETICYNFNNK
jgi:hypothetical protein